MTQINSIWHSPKPSIRAIAFYLPQFHPIPENDAWWGKGFTEWRNVTKAIPLYPGHNQPHLPSDLGFYDLRLPEVREAQAELARNHGIHGFCYYHYWFNGRQLLERPFKEVLESGKPDFPFCLCWANENWARTWDGGATNMLMAQAHSEEDDRAHIQHLIPALKDPRYIRVNGKPLLIIYRPELLPSPNRTAEIWRQAARVAGIGDIYLAAVEKSDFKPEDIGFDASIEFSPNSKDVGQGVFGGRITRQLSRVGILPKVFSQHSVFRYAAVAEGKMKQVPVRHKRFNCVAPSWDNTPRRQRDGRILVGSTPALYEKWLSTACQQTCARLEGDERIVFINAWNEWAEGCHLEPDLKWGHAYLEATNRALRGEPLSRPTALGGSGDRKLAKRVSTSGLLRQWYWRMRNSAAHGVDIAKMALRLPTNL